MRTYWINGVLYYFRSRLIKNIDFSQLLAGFLCLYKVKLISYVGKLNS